MSGRFDLRRRAIPGAGVPQLRTLLQPLLRPLVLPAMLPLLLTACHRTADLLEVDVPVAKSELALRAETRGDTMRVLITLGDGPATSLGSLTAEVTRPAGHRYVGCDPAQGDALLACKEHGAAVRVAGAWAAGTGRGAIVALRFVRDGASANSASATDALSGWTLVVTEVHGARGQSLVDSLVVRREGGAR